MRDALLRLPASEDVAVDPTPIPEISPTIFNGQSRDVVLTATKKVNVYQVSPTTGILGNGGNLKLVLDRGNQTDPIFVIRTGPPSTNNSPVAPPSQVITFGNPDPNTGGVVTVTLKGVAANNVFWVADRNLTITDRPHQLVGNFIGGGFLNLGTRDRRGVLGSFTQPQIKAVRFLGFLVRANDLKVKADGFLERADNKPVFPPSTTAMTTTDEPLLVPVLQLHSPSGTPSASPFGNDKLNDTWLQRATETTFNAVLIMGDSPSRRLDGVPDLESESGGGLPNFARFLEAWEAKEGNTLSPATISGGFIQFFRSKYASAPFEAIDNIARDNSLFFDDPTNSGNAAYTSSTDDKGFRYRGGSSGRKAPYYRPPNRKWGYDVGLLKQTPDLFSRRFATPSAGTPNEYYREVGRDDKWVQALLCATEPNTGGTFVPSLDNADRPPNCP
jgi:hypothetical protein